MMNKIKKISTFNKKRNQLIFISETHFPSIKLALFMRINFIASNKSLHLNSMSLRNKV